MMFSKQQTYLLGEWLQQLVNLLKVKNMRICQDLANMQCCTYTFQHTRLV